MASSQLYRRTEAGKLAWQRQDASVPVEYRRVLGLIHEAEVSVDSLRVPLSRYPEAGLQHLLEEMVEQGLLEAVAAGEHHDLDFTGELNLGDLKKKAAR